MKSKYLFFAASAALLAALQPAAAQLKVGNNPTLIVPGAKLQVDGDNTTTTPAALIVTSTGTGVGTAAPHVSAALDVSSTSKGLLPPRMTTAERDAIPQPAPGLLVYNTTLNCLQLNVGMPAAPSWQCLVGAGSTATNPTSNGTAAVVSYNCSGADAGTLTAGTAASGVTRIITANVTTPGTYNISAAANGVSFSGSGTFAATGSQNITLTASGAPITTGTHSYTLNTSPGCSFSRTTSGATSPSSGGSAVVGSYNCNTASAGTLATGIAASGVTQTITADVTTPGTYSITATANGVTFSGAGTFSGTGNQNIVLNATGTPTAAGSHTFTLSTTLGCSFTRTTLTMSGFDNATSCYDGSSTPAFHNAFPAGDVRLYTANVAANIFTAPAPVRNVQGDCSGNTAPTGTKYIEINGPVGVSIDLVVPLAPGSTFTKTFYVRKRYPAQSGGGSVRIGVSAAGGYSGGGTNALFTIPTPTSTTWSPITVTFTVPAGTNWRWLTIEGTDAYNYMTTAIDY